MFQTLGLTEDIGLTARMEVVATTPSLFQGMKLLLVSPWSWEHVWPPYWFLIDISASMLSPSNPSPMTGPHFIMIHFPLSDTTTNDFLTFFLKTRWAYQICDLGSTFGWVHTHQFYSLLFAWFFQAMDTIANHHHHHHHHMVTSSHLTSIEAMQQYTTNPMWHVPF